MLLICHVFHYFSTVVSHDQHFEIDIVIVIYITVFTVIVIAIVIFIVSVCKSLMKAAPTDDNFLRFTLSKYFQSGITSHFYRCLARLSTAC